MADSEQPGRKERSGPGAPGRAAETILTALDALLDAEAFRRGMGRWDFLQSIDEIDASHWAKILKGSARLSPGKFRLLSKLLCTDAAGMARLERLYGDYRSTARPGRPQTRGSTGPIPTPKVLPQNPGDLLAGAGLRPADLTDEAGFRLALDRLIRLPRLAGRFAEAAANGEVLLKALNGGDITLHPDLAEEHLVDVSTSLCYVAYQTGDADLFLRTLARTHAPGDAGKVTGLVKAARLHMDRRYREVFTATPLTALVAQQRAAMGVVEGLHETRNSRIPLQFMIAQNYSRLQLLAGAAHTGDQRVLQASVDLSDAREHMEFQAVCRAHYSRWHMARGGFDAAQTLLEDAVSLLDRKLGKYPWARAIVRKHQAEAVWLEMQQAGPTVDRLETCLGYLNDAEIHAATCGNSFISKRLKTMAGLVETNLAAA